jgi:hypothetical protein
VSVLSTFPARPPHQSTQRSMRLKFQLLASNSLRGRKARDTSLCLPRHLHVQVWHAPARTSLASVRTSLVRLLGHLDTDSVSILRNRAITAAVLARVTGAGWLYARKDNS